MLTRGLFLILFFFSIECANAQYLAGPKGSFHVYDIHYADAEKQDDNDPKIDWGYKFGLSSYFPLTKQFSLGWDLLFSKKGRNTRMVESDWRLNEKHYYLEFPILLTMKFETKTIEMGPFRKLGPFTGYFGVGPNMSYWLSGSGVLETVGNDHNYKLKFDEWGSDVSYLYLDPVNRFQWGLDLAFGLFSPLTNHSQLLTEFRFTISHTNLGYENSSYMPILGFDDDLEANYRTISFSMAYLFYLDPGTLLKGKSTKGQKIKAKSVGAPRRKSKNTGKSPVKRKVPKKKK